MFFDFVKKKKTQIRACISRFKDCPICGADIEKIEADSNLQDMVDRFIEGHARIKRSNSNIDKEEVVGEKKPVIYADVSLERGAFLVQQAMRVSMSCFRIVAKFPFLSTWISWSKNNIKYNSMTIFFFFWKYVIFM